MYMYYPTLRNKYGQIVHCRPNKGYIYIVVQIKDYVKNGSRHKADKNLIILRIYKKVTLFDTDAKQCIIGTDSNLLLNLESGN